VLKFFILHVNGVLIDIFDFYPYSLNKGILVFGMAPVSAGKFSESLDRATRKDKKA